MNKLCHACGQVKEHKSWKANTCNECLSAGYKWCPDCCTVHSIDNFYKNGKTIRSICKACECARSKINHESNEYYSKPEVKEQRNKTSSECKRRLYATDDEYRSKEKQRCRVREATKENRGFYTELEWTNSLKSFKYSCAYCGSTHSITKEHIIPLAAGGSNTIENVIPACLRCNASKSDDEVVEWYLKQSFYSDERLMHITAYVASLKGSDAKCLI